MSLGETIRKMSGVIIQLSVVTARASDAETPDRSPLIRSSTLDQWPPSRRDPDCQQSIPLDFDSMAEYVPAEKPPRLKLTIRRYWVSKKQYWCKYCNIFVRDDAPVSCSSVRTANPSHGACTSRA